MKLKTILLALVFTLTCSLSTLADACTGSQVGGQVTQLPQSHGFIALYTQEIGDETPLIQMVVEQAAYPYATAYLYAEMHLSQGYYNFENATNNAVPFCGTVTTTVLADPYWCGIPSGWCGRKVGRLPSNYPLPYPYGGYGGYTWAWAGPYTHQFVITGLGNYSGVSTTLIGTPD